MLPHPQPTPRPFDAGRQHGVLLNEVFPECVGDNLVGALAAGCTSDVRQVSPGDAFVALDDGENDGHESAVAAVARGAVAVVCERAVPVFNVPVYIVEDSRVALGQLCQALVDHPSRQLRVIGVAGTLGKSTVVALLESIFEVARQRQVVDFEIRSIGVATGDKREVGCTQPGSAAAVNIVRVGDIAW